MMWFTKKILPEKALSSQDETQAETQNIIDDLPHSETPEMVTVTVAPGKTVQIAKKSYGPGSEVEVEPSDVPRLKKIGFIL